MAVTIPGGTYTFTRGAPLPPEVAGGRQEGACDYFWAVIGYTSECPDVWAGELGILVDVIDESGFENCPATFPIEGSSEPGECPGNINGYDRASTTAFYCKDADGIFQYSGGSLCCEYFPCGTNPGVSGTTLGCNCPEGIPCPICPGGTLPTTLTLSDGSQSITLEYGFLGLEEWRPTTAPPEGFLGCLHSLPAFFCSDGIVGLVDSENVINFSVDPENIYCDPLEIHFLPQETCDGNIVTLIVTE